MTVWEHLTCPHKGEGLLFENTFTQCQSLNGRWMWLVAMPLTAPAWALPPTHRLKHQQQSWLVCKGCTCQGSGCCRLCIDHLKGTILGKLPHPWPPKLTQGFYCEHSAMFSERSDINRSAVWTCGSNWEGTPADVNDLLMALWQGCLPWLLQQLNSWRPWWSTCAWQYWHTHGWHSMILKRKLMATCTASLSICRYSENYWRASINARVSFAGRPVRVHLVLSPVCHSHLGSLPRLREERGWSRWRSLSCQDGESNDILGHLPKTFLRISSNFLEHNGSITGRVADRRRCCHKGGEIEIPCKLTFSEKTKTHSEN